MKAAARLAANVYGALLRLYPPDFYALFGQEMRSTFAEQLTEAAACGMRRFILVCLRELCDWPASVLQEYWLRPDAQRIDTENRSMPSSATPCKKIALAVLPGILFLAQKLYENLTTVDYTLPWNAALAWSLPLFCGLLCVSGVVRERKFQPWSFPALGVVVGYAVVYLLYLLFVVSSFFLKPERLQAMAPYGELLFSTYGESLFRGLEVLYIVPPTLIGLRLARQSGVLAGLLVVGAAYVPWSSFGEPQYALLMFTDSQALVTFVAVCPQLFFLILAPAMVLYLSSTEARLAGYVLTIGGGLVTATGIGSALRPYPSFIWTMGWHFTMILLPLAIALGWYARARHKTLVLNHS